MGAGPSPNASDPLIGRSLGEFVVEEAIGAGGFGAVYRARQRLLDREAVIKVLQAQHLGSHSATQRFLREAKLASSLDHPFAAHIYAFGAEPDGILWIAMELVRGTPLDQLLRMAGPISLERLVPFIERLCEVVQTAHDQGIVHRDIKPANIMVLSRAGRLLPKLLDFGIAKNIITPSAPATTPVDIRGSADLVSTTVASDQGVLDTFEVGVGGDAATLSASDQRKPGSHSADSQALTHQGATMGSPLYMSPEQWDDSARADGRADLYAIGVLTFEALTGRPPFVRSSMREMALAHAVDPIPALGGDHPPALDRFFATALAKRASDRFDSAVAMAAAFRQASGLVHEPMAVPRLGGEIREELLTNWPTPIAEAVAGFEAARNLHQARDAMRDLVATTARYIAALAIAARSRVGTRQPDPAQVTERLRQLFRNQLSDPGWVELATELVTPWRDYQDAYPLPELIELLPGPGGGAHHLMDLTSQLLQSTGRTDEEVRGEVESYVRAFEELARKAAFLAQYRLVVGRSDGAEQWTGVRRRQTIAVSVRGRSLAPSEVALVDERGTPILSLTPLIQAAAPSQGAGDELFMVDGRGRRGVRMVAWPHGFERQDVGAEKWFRREFADLLAGSMESSVEERAPYRGLSPFTSDDASFYFGREQAIEEAVNRLAVQPWLAVVGPSGAGKSSFVQAGVIPMLRGSWRVASMRPGYRPCRALNDALAQLPARTDVDRRLLVVDQAEELFTLCGSADEREQFAAQIADHCDSGTLRVIVTLRDDFLVDAEQLLAWRGRVASSLLLLSTPKLDDLIRVLVEPARRAGYEFDDAELPREMATEVMDRAGALPLLSFTAAQLWEVRDRHFRQLTRKSYKAIGGVAGALAGHAEGVLAGMSREEQRLTRKAFHRLVTAEGTRAVLGRRELLESLGSSSSADSVVKKLIEARLLVTSDRDDNGDAIEIVHEALLDAWPRLQMWTRENAQGARLRDQLRTAARQWDERGRPAGLLWRDEALTEYTLWRKKHPDPLPSVEQAFADRSLADGLRRSRIRRAVVIGAFVTLAGALAVFFQLSQMERSQRQAAAAERQRAEDLLIAGWVEQGSRAMLAEDSLSALVYFQHALMNGRDSDAIRYQVARGLRTVEAELGALEGHRGAIWAVAISSDGSQLLSAGNDGKALLWSVPDRKLLRSLEHPVPVRTVAFAGRSNILATGADDGIIRLFSDGEQPIELAGHDGPIVELRPSPDGSRLLSTSVDQSTRVWDLAAGGAVLVHRVGGPGIGGDFSADGQRLVLARGALDAEIASLSGQTEVQLQAPTRDGEGGPYNLFLRMSPRGDRVLATGWNTPGHLWDAETGQLVAVLDGATGNRNYGEFSPDGSLVVTTASGESAAIWSADNGKLLSVLRGHLGAVNTVALLPGGERLLTGAMDGMVRLWDIQTGLPLATHASHDRPVFALAARGNVLASAGWDGAVRLFRPSRGDLRGVHTSPQPLAGIAELPAGQRLGLFREDGSVSVHDAHNAAELDSEQQAFVQGEKVVALAQHRPTNLLAVARAPATIELWDVNTRERVAVRPGQASKLRFSPSGQQLLIVSDGKVEIWQWASDQHLTLGEIGDAVEATWLSDTEVASASPNRVSIFERSGQEVSSIELPGAIPLHLAVSADRQAIAAACADSLVRIIDVPTMQLRGSLRGHTGSVTWSGFVPGTDLVASADSDGSVRIWNGINLSPLAMLRGHEAPIIDAQFDRTGESLTTVGLDGRLLIWDLGRATGSAEAIADAITCSVPRALERGRIVARPIPVSCQRSSKRSRLDIE